ncbi:MAG: DUF2206 domain-containing protein, partial [Halobacteriaceae archaeon]
MSTHTRQGTAIVFVTLIVFVMFHHISKNKKGVLLPLLWFGLIISHYGTTYLFLAIVYLSFIIIRSSHVLSGYSGYINNISKIFKEENAEIVIYSLSSSAIALVITVAWYMKTAEGWAFRLFINILANLPSHVIGIISGGTRGARKLTRSYPSLSIQLIKYIYLLFLLLMCAGVCIILAHRILYVFDLEIDQSYYENRYFSEIPLTYLVFSIAAISTLGGTLV